MFNLFKSQDDKIKELDLKIKAAEAMLNKLNNAQFKMKQNLKQADRYDAAPGYINGYNDAVRHLRMYLEEK